MCEDSTWLRDFQLNRHSCEGRVPDQGISKLDVLNKFEIPAAPGREQAGNDEFYFELSWSAISMKKKFKPLQVLSPASFDINYHPS